MNKKGFTLTELLGVIVVLAVIISIAGVSVVSIMNKATDKTIEEMQDNLKDSAIRYVIDNKLASASYCYLQKDGTLNSNNVEIEVPAKTLVENGEFEDNKGYCYNKESGKNAKVNVSTTCKKVNDKAVSDYEATITTKCTK